MHYHSAGYVTDRIAGYRVVEGCGRDGGSWFVTGRGARLRFRSRREALDHIEMVAEG